MGRVLIAIAAVMSVAGLLAVVLAPQGPRPTPLAGPTPSGPVEAPAPLLEGRAPDRETVAPQDEEVVEEEIEEIDPRDAPPDPVERGACRLAIQLTTDSEEPEPVDTKLELWRIGEPGNEHWTAGDRRIATLATKGGGAEATELAPGRYRIHAHAQRKGSEDPEAFEVEGPETTIAFAVPAPRRFKVRLRVYGGARTLVLRGHKQAGGQSTQVRSGDRQPEWVQRRRLRAGFLNGSLSLGCGVGCGFGRGAKVPVEALNGTFDLFVMRESERRRSWCRSYYLYPEEGTRVYVYARSDTARDRVFVGVTLPLDELHDAIRLPDGTRAIDAGASIQASSTAVLVKEDGVEPGIHELPIEVNVHLKGYASLHFLHTLDRPLDERTLVPNVE